MDQAPAPACSPLPRHSHPLSPGTSGTKQRSAQVVGGGPNNNPSSRKTRPPRRRGRCHDFILANRRKHGLVNAFYGSVM